MSRMRQKRKARGRAERDELARAAADAASGGGEGGEPDLAAAEAGEADGDEEEAGGDDEAELPADSAEDADAGIDHPHEAMPELGGEHGDGGEAGDAADAGDGGDGGDAGDADPDADLEPVRGISPARLKTIVESLLFAADKPLAILQLKQLTGERNAAALQAALDSLTEDYRDRGIVLGELAGGYQFRTHPSSAEYVQRLIAGRPVRLSRAQLETLAIIAYRQPVTRPEIDEIRGVDCGGTLKILLDRALIRVLGKKEEPGRPLLYGTSKEFLEFFNLKDLRDLPTLREFHELSEESLRVVEKLDAEVGDEAGAGADPAGEEAGAGADPVGEPAAGGEEDPATGAAAASAG